MNGITGIRESLYLASSALQAQTTEIHISAHNIANVSTGGYEPWRALSSTGPQGKGVKIDALVREGQPLGGHDSRITHADKDITQTIGEDNSHTDIAREFSLMIDSHHAFDANASVIRAADEMLGTLLNIKA